MCAFTKKNCFKFICLKGKNQIVPSTQCVYMFMHPSMMKTLELKRSSLVLLHTEEGELLFRCWPCISLELQKLTLSSIYLFQDYFKGDIFCDHYKLLLGSADMVILNCDNPKSFMEMESFKNIIKNQLNLIYIREDLKLNITYLGYPCFFTVKKIYGHSTDNILNQQGLLDICRNMSSLNLSKNSSILETSYDETSFICSTPISSKHSANHTALYSQKRKHVSELPQRMSQQFYCTHIGTRIVIQNPKEVKEINPVTLQHFGGLKRQITEIKSWADSLLNQDSIHERHCQGIILIGASGTGKTAVVQAIKNEFCLPLFNLNDAISDSDEDECKYQLKKLYDEITYKQPCLVFLDNIDSLHKNGDNVQSQSKLLIFLSTMIHDLLSLVLPEILLL